jgi:hypothetical protein
VISGGEDGKLYYWQRQSDGSYQERILMKDRWAISDLKVTPNQEIVYVGGREICKLY